MSWAVASASSRGRNGRILRAASAVTLATVVVKAFGLAKEVVVASVYGRSDALEAFLIAALVPGLLVNLIAESTNQALIPTLVRVRERDGKEYAGRLFSNVLAWSLLLLASSSLLMATAARELFPLIGSHFSPTKLELAVRLFYGMLPVIALTGLASICSSVLNTEGKFAGPAAISAMTPLLFVVLVPLLAPKWGAWAMVWAMVAGAGIQAAWMFWKTKMSGYPLVPRWFEWDGETRQVAAQFRLVALSGVVASGGLLVDQAMAARLPAGSVAALAYAGRFVSVMLAVLGGAVSSALTPSFSEMVARTEWDACRRTMRLWVWGAGVVSGLAAVTLIGCSGILVRVTLQHGAFGARDSAAVSLVLMMYALQIPFFVSSRVYYRFLVAARRTEIVLYCGVANLVLDVVLNLLLMRWMGVAGIALATSLWTVSTLIFLWYWSGRVLAEASRRVLGTKAAN